MPDFYERIGLENDDKAWAAQSEVAHILNEASCWESDLADMLHECKPLALCKLEACPICSLHFARDLLDEIMKSDLRCGGWTLVRYAPATEMYRRDELDKADLHKIVRAVKKSIKRSSFGDAMVIGGIDVSFNTIGENEVGWKFEVRMLVNRDCSDDLKAHVTAEFASAAGSQGTFTVRAIQPGYDSFMRCLTTYAHKQVPLFRSGHFFSNRQLDHVGEAGAVNELPMNSEQVLELAEWLGQYMIGSRLILRKIERQGEPGEPLNLKPKAALEKPVWTEVPVPRGPWDHAGPTDSA